MQPSKFLSIILSFSLLFSCQPKTDDPEVLKKVLTDYFDGIKEQDVKKLNALTTKDFVLFEDGKIWNNDSLVQPMPGEESFTASWVFDSVKVEMDQQSGHMVYLNHGDFVINDTINMQFNWVESAYFKKVDGQWKLHFLHSTVRK
jgi:cytochrome oxidase Cu insertion factor (SCO1/SenC/PrrC family)